MKSMFKILTVFVVVSFVSFGCNKVKDLSQVNFDSTFSTDLDCVVPAAAARAIVPTFGASAVINPTSDPNVNLYLNSIEGYDIQALKATVTSISQENVTLVSGYMIIKNFARETKWDFENELMNVGKTFTLGNENGEWDQVSLTLKDGQEFTVLITGETDFANVTFTIKVEIVTKVTANLI